MYLFYSTGSIQHGEIIAELKKILKDALNDRFAALCTLIQPAVSEVAIRLFQYRLIPDAIMKTENPSSNDIISSIITALDWIEEQENIEQHCIHFLSVLVSMGGNFAIAAIAIKDELRKRAKDQLGIELNLH